jgi:iron complex transport system ATP-binding protein
MIDVRSATLAYDRYPPVLTEATLSMPGGVLASLIGANGSGKSTLLRALAGFHPPRAGEITADGHPIYGRGALSRRDRARRIAVVLTRFDAPAYLRVHETVALGHEAYIRAGGSEPDRTDDVVRSRLDLCGAGALHDRLLAELSDGERQRVMLARALAQKPRILLLDEPTAHLDPPHQTGVFSILRDLTKTGRVDLVVVATHQIHLALHFSDRVVLFVPSPDGIRLLHDSPGAFLASRAIDTAYPDRSDTRFDPDRGWFVPES